MKKSIFYLLSVAVILTSCTPVTQQEKEKIVENPTQNEQEIMASHLSLRVIQSVCTKLANFRDQLDGVKDPRTTDLMLVSELTGGFEHIELLYIVSRYGRDIGKDAIYEKCVKYLYLFNDGEGYGIIYFVIPDSKEMCDGKSQEWLISS